MKIVPISLTVASAFLMSTPWPATAASPTPIEMNDVAQWVSAKFEGTATLSQPPFGIFVKENHDPVHLNERHGKPLQLAGRTYSKGLYCHANSHLIIQLPEPGITLKAIVGVDSNEQTSGGKGSVQFSVHRSDQEIWTSGIMHEGTPAESLALPLHEATTFELRISDAGDGISCDQADWANAQVTLKSGSTLYLSDLPLLTTNPPAYTTEPFISFKYGDEHSSQFLSSWPLARTMRPLDEQRVEHTMVYTDPKTNLEIRIVGIQYLDYPTVEWTAYFKNKGTQDSPIISDIRSLDTPFFCPEDADFVLHGNKGDNCTADSFEPYKEKLAANTTKTITNTGGRPTQIAFPYFTLNTGNQGLIAVVSWAGQWKTEFIRNETNALTLRAGQELTHFTLHPDEEIRTPLIVLQFWRGDTAHAQNVWRQWMIAHNIPRQNGQLPPLPQLAACSSHQFGEMIHANTENQQFFIDKYLERGIKLDYWWMDAGWYPCDGQWPKTGTWEVDESRFPGGFKPITDHAHSKDVKSIVWFEPERVTPDTWLTQEHPDWILGGAKGGLLNLGNTEAREWLINHIDTLITQQGIDLYRQDFNMDPLSYWREHDEENRQGITEIRHVEGYLMYWDELRKRHPGMLIDSCASGGRRNDLETLRRALPLLRSDYIMEPIGNQCHTYTLAAWFPFFGTGSSQTAPYLIESTLCPHFTACWDQRNDKLNYPMFNRIINAWKDYAPAYFGDYYPLTSYSLQDDAWIAWEFIQRDGKAGFIQAFRRENSPYETASFQLKGLLDESYAFFDVAEKDHPKPSQSYILRTAEELTRGVPVTITEKPGSAIIVFKTTPSRKR